MYIYFYLLVFIITLNAQEIKTINIASIDWCPQLCPNESKNGYVIDILNEIFKNTNYKLNIKTYPWSRAIAMTKRAEVMALLSPAKTEAPTLTYPKIGIGKQTMCFFVKNNSKWVYKDISSLKNKSIGIAKDTSIEELNKYIHTNPKQFQYLPYSKTYIIQSLKKLDRNRFDTFLFTKNSTLYAINSLGLQNKYKIAGCVSSSDIYIAFTSDVKFKNDIKQLIAFFDINMQKLKKTKKIDSIMMNYGLEK